MKKLFFLGSLLATLAITAMSFYYFANEKKTLQNLSGTYEDAQPYAYGQAWGHRTFTFDQGKWTLKFTLALDPELKNPVFIFRTYGDYKVLRKSKLVKNAYEALFLEDKKFVTLKTDNQNLVNAFGFAPCGMTVNVEKDISQAGCSAWKAVTVCNQDNDLLALDKDGNLYFGERPADNDMCSPEKRPTKLTPPVVKVK